MEGYASEQEQIEAIKKWWKENGKFIIVGLVLGFVVLIGSRTWIEHKHSLAEGASMEFEQLLVELNQQNNEAVDQRAERIISTYPKTPYAPLAAMALAKAKIADGDLAAAHEKLQWALDHAQQPEIQHTARLRLAKVLIAQGESTQAISLLDGADADNFRALYEEVKGDAYRATGDTAKAVQSYKQAMEAQAAGVPSQQLQMKLDDVSPEIR